MYLKWNYVTYLFAYLSSCNIILSYEGRFQISRDWTIIKCCQILPEQDMVSNLDPCMTPSHVWMPSLDFTGIVPSPDSIFVLNWPLAFRLGWRSVAPVKALLATPPSHNIEAVAMRLHWKVYYISCKKNDIKIVFYNICQ